MNFVSLGDNCEFGFVQRHFGAEPLSFFRFSNPRAEMILRGVRTMFDELGESLVVELNQQSPREWFVSDPIYEVWQHTFIYEGDPKENNIKENMKRHFGFLKRQLLEDIEIGEKVFVIKAVPNLPESLARDIASSLRERGPAWLLWVVDELGSPKVERMQPGLLKGKVNGIVREGGAGWGDFPWAGWLEVLTEAWRLTRGGV